MKLKTLIITSIGALTISIANAGDSKGVVCPVEEPFGATLSAGYDSHYIFRGVDNGQNAISVGLDYDLDLLPIPVTLGAHYINPTDGSLVNPTHSDELQLSAAVGQSFGSVDAWLGYTAYLFPENGGRTAGDSTNEIGVGAGTSVGIIDLNAGAYYDFDIDGWYFQVSAGHTRELTDTISLALSAGISYQIDYWSAGDDWNNVLLMAALPIELTSKATLRPYVAATFALNAIDAWQDDQLFGGVSLSVDF